MKNFIIEIVELGKPQSIIQRQGDPITELIHTDILIEELNNQLSAYQDMLEALEDIKSLTKDSGVLTGNLHQIAKEAIKKATS